MFSEKKITEKKLGTAKSVKSLKSITFKPQQEVFIIPKSEQDDDFRDCCCIM